MIASLLPFAGENLLATYRALALAVPGCRLVEEEAFTLTEGCAQHPLGAFAVLSKPDAFAARELRTRLNGARAYQIFVPPHGDVPALEEVLLRNDFLLSRRQVVMGRAAPAETTEDLDVAIEEVSGGAISGFIARQFFDHGSPRFRADLESTLTSVIGMRFWAMRVGDKVRAAAMTSDSEGGTGLYNVCVDVSMRGRGYGRQLVLTLGNVFHDRALTLQCRPSIVGFYLQLGFVPIGYAPIFAVHAPRP